MLFAVDMQLPVVDGADLPLPVEGRVTLFQAESGLSLLYPDGTIAAVDSNPLGYVTLDPSAARNTDLLLQQILGCLRHIESHLSLINEVTLDGPST